MFRFRVLAGLLIASFASTSAHAAAERVRVPARVGVARAGTRGRQGVGLSGVESAAGSTPHRGTPESGRAHAQRRPRDLHRCGTRDRLVAGADADRRQSQSATRVRPGTSRRRTTSIAWKYRRGSTAPRATFIRAAIHTSSSTRTTSRRSPRSSATGWRKSIRRTPRSMRARGEDFQTRWQRGNRAVGATGGAAAKECDWCRITRTPVYLIHWLGMVEVMDIEPKPGIPPSAGYLSELVDKIQRDGADAITRSMYTDPKAPQWLSEHTQRAARRSAVHRRRHARSERSVRALRRHHRAARNK